MPAKKEDVKKEEVKQGEAKAIVVEVEQNVESPAVYSSLFFKGRMINFENGKATVDADLAKELKKANYVK